MSSKEFLVVIPAWNEEEVLPLTLKKLFEFVPKSQIVVVDDGSEDQTRQIALQNGVNVVPIPINVGVGAAVRAGIQFAQLNDFKKMIQFDADLQHRPEYILDLVHQLDRFDVVVGSRFLASDNYKMSLIRRTASRLLTSAIFHRTNVRMTDVTSGFRGANTKAIGIFARKYPSAYLADTVESLVIAHDAGLKIGEYSTPMNIRAGGVPSHGPFKSALHMMRVLLVLISTFSLGTRDVVQESEDLW